MLMDHYYSSKVNNNNTYKLLNWRLTSILFLIFAFVFNFQNLCAQQCVAELENVEHSDGSSGFFDMSNFANEGDFIISFNLIIQNEQNNVFYSDSKIDTVPFFPDAVGQKLFYIYSIETEFGCTDTNFIQLDCYAC